jgi:hypothetical protein
VNTYTLLTHFGHELFVRVEAENEDDAELAAKMYAVDHLGRCEFDPSDVDIVRTAWGLDDEEPDFHIRAVGKNGRYTEL